MADDVALWRWGLVTGAAVQKYVMNDPRPIGVNAAGQPAARQDDDNDGRLTVKVWPGTEFYGELPINERVLAVAENNDLAGQRKAADGRWVPATRTCE
ncbi:hypothetical protein C8D87_105569 [Lentzea atacamensis]|uniref:Uncharacterized protein n=1 Tax=Lentzea atacamensis TaxID=531938 RepID=A0ABX9E9D8_9PSEU|nr:hypothetical protein [Lentzea atacamensis]RAS65074.1 hypothetical protein C8D87_105569 [Lentzea atacamensis]